MPAFSTSMTSVMLCFSRIDTTTDSTGMVRTATIHSVQVDFIEEPLWMASTALVILEGIRTFESMRHTARFIELPRACIEGIVIDSLAMGFEVGMANELDDKGFIDQVGGGPCAAADKTLECTELGLVISEAIAISRSSSEVTKVGVKL